MEEFNQAQSSTPQQKGPYIEFQGVSKTFGDNRVLDNVSFDVMDGETVCILGRSGVGKSVSLHHIMGFLKPDSGRVIVAHEDITDYGEQDLERIRAAVATGNALGLRVNAGHGLHYHNVQAVAALPGATGGGVLSGLFGGNAPPPAR